MHILHNSSLSHPQITLAFRLTILFFNVSGSALTQDSAPLCLTRPADRSLMDSCAGSGSLGYCQPTMPIGGTPGIFNGAVLQAFWHSCLWSDVFIQPSLFFIPLLLDIKVLFHVF